MTSTEMEDEIYWRKAEKAHRRGKVAGGFLILSIGAIFLARELGVEFPHWLFTWKILVIAIGLVLMVKHGLRRPMWIVPILVGGAFLLGDFYPDLKIKPLLWPAVLMVVGLVIMFKPRNRHHRQWSRWKRHEHRKCRSWDGSTRAAAFDDTSDDFIDSTAVFGGIKKNVITKNFKGGDVTTVFGGTEINLTQADFEGSATLDITQVMGGTRLIIPANWEIKSSLVTILGSIEDKRPVQTPVAGDRQKILKIEGTSIFGGIEIQSFS